VSRLEVDSSQLNLGDKSVFFRAIRRRRLIIIIVRVK